MATVSSAFEIAGQPTSWWNSTAAPRSTIALAKVRRYAAALPRSTLRELTPVVLLVVPNAARAARAAHVLGSIAVRASALVWTPETRRSTLTAVNDALDAQLTHRPDNGGAGC